MRAERINHCLPAVEMLRVNGRGYSVARTFPTENLRDAVLLVEETLLVHLIKQAAFAVPRGERQKIFLSFFFGPDVAHLHYNEGVFALGPGRQEDVRIKFARSALDAVAEMPDKGRSGSAVEAAETGLGSHLGYRFNMDALEKIARKHDTLTRLY